MTEVTEPVVKGVKLTKAQYQAHCIETLAFIRDARKQGNRNAREFVAFLTAAKFPAPNGGPWSQSAVLRVLKKLKLLGLDYGSFSHGVARKIWYVGNPNGATYSSAEKAAVWAKLLAPYSKDLAGAAAQPNAPAADAVSTSTTANIA